MFDYILFIFIFRSPRFFLFLPPVHCHKFRLKHEHCVQQNWRRSPIRCHISLLCCSVYVFFTDSTKLVTNTDGVSRRYIWFTAQGGWNSLSPSLLLILSFTMAQQPLVGQGILIIKALRSHSDTPHSVGVISSSQRPLPDNTQHSQQTDIHVPGGTRTHSPSKRAAADPCLRQRGHWDRHDF